MTLHDSRCWCVDIFTIDAVHSISHGYSSGVYRICYNRFHCIYWAILANRSWSRWCLDIIRLAANEILISCCSSVYCISNWSCCSCDSWRFNFAPNLFIIGSLPQLTLRSVLCQCFIQRIWSSRKLGATIAGRSYHSRCGCRLLLLVDKVAPSYNHLVRGLFHSEVITLLEAHWIYDAWCIILPLTLYCDIIPLFFISIDGLAQIVHLGWIDEASDIHWSHNITISTSRNHHIFNLTAIVSLWIRLITPSHCNIGVIFWILTPIKLARGYSSGIIIDTCLEIEFGFRESHHVVIRRGRRPSYYESLFWSDIRWVSISSSLRWVLLLHQIVDFLFADFMIDSFKFNSTLQRFLSLVKMAGRRCHKLNFIKTVVAMNGSIIVVVNLIKTIGWKDASWGACNSYSVITQLTFRWLELFRGLLLSVKKICGALSLIPNVLLYRWIVIG